MGTTVLSLGGSIVAPEAPDAGFLRGFCALVRERLASHPDERIILVVGGGGPARLYQGAYRECSPAPRAESQDWVGIMATRLNAELLRRLLEDHCLDEVVTDPSAPIAFGGRVLVAAGWKPGFSTDFDAVLLAERFGAGTVVNLSNIEKVFTADPRLDKDAKPIDRIGWKAFQAIVGEEWVPGKNAPFDPIATKKARELALRVVVAAGRDLPNLRAIMEGQPFKGTLIEGE